MQVTGVPAVHAPAWQVSDPLQAFPSLQPDPFMTGMWVQVPSWPHASAVQGLPSSQLTVPAQVPPVHLSPTVQLLPSLQPVPSTTLVVTQPFTGSHDAIWQGLVDAQVSPTPEVHTPPTQVSAPSHTVLSLHGVPSARLDAAEHTPPVQVLAEWQRSAAGQVDTTAAPKVPAALQARGLVALLPAQLPGAPQAAPAPFCAQRPAPAPVATHIPVKQLGALAESAGQAVAQQILSTPVPCTQAPLAHSLSTRHLVPLGETVPQVLPVELHVIPGAQSVAPVAGVQVVRQTFPLQV